MDTSKEYIKMCERAEEIQNLWNPTIGDFIVVDYRETTGFDREIEETIWGDDDETWIRICNLTQKSIKDFIHISDETGTHTHTLSDLVRKQNIWLSRQDQLQEILGGDIFANCWNIAYYVSPFINTELTDYYRSFKTMEQLWLAFVMHECFKKTWLNGDWVKDENR